VIIRNCGVPRGKVKVRKGGGEEERRGGGEV